MVEGPPETLHTSVEAKYLSGHGAAKGWSTNNVCLGDLRVSLSSGLIRGCFGAALGFKTEENENV